MGAARGGEEAEGGVVAKTGVDGEGRSDAPRIFGVEAEAAKRLREGAIACGGVRAGGVGKGGGSAVEISSELRGIVEIEGWILGELDEMFGGGGECAAQNRFVDEIDAKADGVTARAAKNVVAELIFLLIAFDGEGGDYSGELIVAESFESGSGMKICAERKRQCQAEIGVAGLGVMKVASFESERALPVCGEAILLAEKNIEVIRSAGGAGGRQSGLLDEIVLGAIAIERGAEKPLSICGLRPIETHVKKIIAKGNGNICGDGDGIDARN